MELQDHGGVQRSSGKLESLPKDELLKLIKRQALASKDLKKKVADLEEALTKEKQEVNQLEIEKKEWISRGVSAEFEKKEKNKDDLISKLRQEKENLSSALKSLQDEFETTVLESQELKEKLHAVEEERNCLQTAWDENETLKEKVKDLEQQLANPAKLNKLKEEFDGLGRENKVLREAKMLAEQDRKVKSEQILNFDKDITNLRKDLAEKNKIIKEKKQAMEAMKVHNDELSANLNTSGMRIQELEAEVQKAQVEKEKYLKAIKSMKTKFERSSLIEEELRKQLNTIVGERDELLKKNVKRSQKLKAKESNDSVKKGEIVEELKGQIATLETENSELKEVIESHNKKTEEILTKYENLKRDFDNLNFELDELTAIRNEQIEEKEILTAGNESLTIENEMLTAELQNVRDVVTNLQSEKNVLTEEKSKWYEEKENHVVEIKNLHIDIETLSDEIKELLVERDSNYEEKANVCNEKEALYAKLMEMKDECELHIKENTRIKQEISNIEEEFQIAVKENADLKSQLESVIVELDMFRKGAPETKATIVKLESRVEELLNQLQQLNEEKLNQETALEELFKSHDDLSNKYDFECKEREKKEKEVSHLEEQLTQLSSKEGKEKSTEDLEQQIAMLEETIYDVTTSRDYYQKELLVKEQCIIQLRNDFEEVSKKTNNAINQDMESYLYEMENIRNQLLSVTKELEISYAEKDNLHAQMLEAVSEKDHCNNSLVLVEEKLAEANLNLNIKTLECDEMKQQLIEHSTPNSSQIDINSQQDEIINLQKDLDYLDEQYKQISCENFALKEECQNLIMTKTAYENDLEEIKIRFDQYEKEKISLNDKIIQYNEVSEKYGFDNVYDLDVYISSLTADVDTSTKMLQALTVEKAQVDAKYTEIELKLKCYYVDIEEKNENICRLENELIMLKQEHQILVDHNDSLMKEKANEIYETDDDMAQKDNEIQRLMHEIHEKQNEMYEKENAINRMVIDIHEKESGINEKSKENDQLRYEINQKDNIIEQLSNDIRQYQQSIDSPEPGLAFMEKENEQLHKEIEYHKEELINMKQALNDTHLEMVALKTSEENHSNEILEKHILIGELKAELIGLRELFKTEQERYDHSASSNEELANKLHEKENIVVQLNEELKEAEIALENLKSELDKNNENCSELMEKYGEVQETNRKLLDNNSHFEDNFSGNSATLIAERDRAVEELNQLTIVNVNIENKLEAALDRVMKLQNALEEKSEVINEMEVLLKEKGDKGSKFKNVAIKAKKELEALRTKYQEETTSLEQQVITLREEASFLEKELVCQKTECSKHEEEFEEFQAEIRTLKGQLLAEQESLTAIKETMTIKDEELIKMNESFKVSEDDSRNKSGEIENLKAAMEDLLKRHENALQESTQMTTMKLEIEDYERTVDSLQLKLDKKEKQNTESLETIENITMMQTNMENELTSLKKENADMESKNEKLKAMVMKLKKDISDKERQLEENIAHINGLDMLIEKLKQTIEELKLESASLSAEKSNLHSEMKSTVEYHEKQYQTLEVKMSHVSSDLLTSQKENKNLVQEFEQYKIRAHNVLKQQKSKLNEDEDKGANQQILQLEEAINQLKQKLQDSNESLTDLETTYQDLQTEHEGLQERHHEFIEEIGEKELAWKQKLTQVKLEASTKVLEYQDKLQLLQNENEILQMKNKEIQEQHQPEVASELTNEEKDNYVEEITRLTEELAKLKKVRLEAPPNYLELHKQESEDSRNDSVEYKSVSERQEGEGMDSRELEIIDTLSQRGSIPHTPTSPSHASILERLLSPVEVPILSSPQTPNAMKEELAVAKSSLQTALKKNDHMTALIRESEANASRLADQAKVLKDEIRRLERNEEREQALSNMEYLKNVIIKFLKVGPVEKEQLIPVLSTMLKLSDDEKRFVFEYAKGEAEESEDNGSWSSYVYRWTSLS